MIAPDRPLRLRPDNFTPPTRTPWGGRTILDSIKADLELSPAKRDFAVVGESWEVSVDPAFVSQVVDDGGPDVPLDQVLARDPEAYVGPSHARYAGSTPMLVKLLDAADELSVQVHPSDDYEGLAEHESGKPECWYVIDAQPGAGLYLGLAEGVTESAMASALGAGEDIRHMLCFVEVAPGDTFVIEPGTVHAIGRGVTLVEPQLIVPGRSGKTYRFWDWNRRYDARGRLDPRGQPRELHKAESLDVTAWDAPRGDAFVETTRRRPLRIDDSDRVEHVELCRLGELRVERLRTDDRAGRYVLDPRFSLVACTVVRGSVAVRPLLGNVSGERFERGESFLLPAGLAVAQMALSEASEVVLCWIAESA